ncbi:MAG: SPOR domain-containing protein [Gemmatimonadaceae bacterium]
MPTAVLSRLAPLGALLLAVAAPAAGAQRPAVPSVPAGAVDTMLFVQAQRLVSEGNGAAGRRLVDSVLKESPEGTPGHAEALFWRAVLAASAADAERDYRRLWVEYPNSPRASDALVRLAQLELARGDRDLAMKHLDRLTREYPRSPALPRASYWMARVLLESNDVARACDALATARATAPASSVELVNQIDFLAQRCDGVAVASASKAPAPTSAAPSRPTSTPVAAATPPASRAAAPTSSAAAVPSRASAPVRASEPAPASPAARASREEPAVDTVPQPVTAAEPAPVAAARVDSVAPTPAAPAARPNVIRREPLREPAPTSAAPAAATPVTPPSAARPAAPAGAFAVQVAAYDREDAARNLAGRLTARGLDAYVVTMQGLYKVRVGRYATRADATTALRDLREKKIEGFVVP